MASTVRIQELRGDQIGPWLDALGSLRIRVFREYPYLYDGTADYERDYLAIYQNAPGSMVVVITDADDNLVGATTCLPLAEESAEFQQPFLAQGREMREIMYFGESILLPEWRGQGLGKQFFSRREAHALSLGMRTTAFCAVDRPHDHPLRPPDFRPLDSFWQSRGYLKQPDLRATFPWKETGVPGETPHTLTFWTKSWPI
jgi:GNAT superfamily N-acetyltransferase